MDTLSPHADHGNIPEKRCTQCERNLPATTDYFAQQKSSQNGLRALCKQCQSEYRAAYYAAHREEEKQGMAIYGAEHREELRQYSARYRAEHSEEVKQYNTRYNASDRRKHVKARYKASHLGKIRQYSAKYHAEHREEHRLYRARLHAERHEEELLYTRQYNAEHREERNEKHREYRRTERGRLTHRAHENRRHARKRLVEGVLTPVQIQEKLKAQHYRCYYARCGHAKFEKVKGQYIFHLEHTIPLSRTEHGPRNDINYVVLSCPSCNIRKSNKLPHEFFEGGRLL